MRTTPHPHDACPRFQVTHPFHPLRGEEFELLVCGHAWGEDRVTFHDREGRLRSIPAAWTDVPAPDPFVVIAAGRTPFRLEDLLHLAALLRRLGQ